eukprot:gene4018-4565_t
MQKDEADVQRIVEGLNSWIPELWSPMQPLVKICNGVLATSEMIDNVISTKSRGTEAKNQFLERFMQPAESDAGNEEPALSDPTASKEIPVQSTWSLSYHDPIKKQAVITFENLMPRKKATSIPEDEGKSFAAALAEYDSKKLDLQKIMHWPITSKLWSLCNVKGDSRGSSKSLFRNNPQLLSRNGAIAIPPQDIDCCIVDAMQVVRIMPIKDLNPPTFIMAANVFSEQKKPTHEIAYQVSVAVIKKLIREEELSEMFQESENTHTCGEEQQSQANSEESATDSDEDDEEESEYEEDD